MKADRVAAAKVFGIVFDLFVMGALLRVRMSTGAPNPILQDEVSTGQIRRNTVFGLSLKANYRAGLCNMSPAVQMSRTLPHLWMRAQGPRVPE
jgi:hypothetical protein